jgi:phosphoribosylaminoimidazole-succinocarboxamide synthase
VLAEHGILLADTKFEFGLDARGDVLLIDEVLTPDSSRMWPRATWSPGADQPSYDKQILRDWLERQPWNKQPPAPRIDPTVLARLSQRYVDLCVELTGAAPIRGAL